MQPEKAKVIRTDHDAEPPSAAHEPMGLECPPDTHQAALSRLAGPVITLHGPSGQQVVSSSSSDSIRPTQRRRSGNSEHPKGNSAQQAQMPAFAGQQGSRFSQPEAASSSSSEPLQHVLRHRQSLPQASQPHAAMPSVSSPAHADQAEPCPGPPLVHAALTPAISMPGAVDKPDGSQDIQDGSSALEAEPSRALQNQSPSALIQKQALVPKQMTDGDKDPAQAPRRRQPRELQGLMPFAWDKCVGTPSASWSLCLIFLLSTLAATNCSHLHDVILLSMRFKEMLQSVCLTMPAPALPAACLSGPHC